MGLFIKHIESWQERIKSTRDALWMIIFFITILHIPIAYQLREWHKQWMSQWQAARAKKAETFVLRVTTENINEDKKKKISPITRLSKEDSEGKGAITKKEGVNFFSPFIDFFLGERGRDRQKIISNDSSPQSSRAEEPWKLLQNEKGEVTISLFDLNSMNRSLSQSYLRKKSESSYKIPEFYRFNPDIALKLSNDDRPFSFNTLKYPDYKYFQDMKRKIKKNWLRNMPAGGLYLHGLDTGYYPGMNRVITFKSGVAQIAFALDRQGRIRDLKIMESHASPIMTQACYQAIVDSEEFGPLPSSINGDVLIIPFQFIYLAE